MLLLRREPRFEDRNAYGNFSTGVKLGVFYGYGG